MGGPLEKMEENRAKKCSELGLLYKRVRKVEGFQENYRF